LLNIELLQLRSYFALAFTIIDERKGTCAPTFFQKLSQKLKKPVDLSQFHFVSESLQQRPICRLTFGKDEIKDLQITCPSLNQPHWYHIANMVAPPQVRKENPYNYTTTQTQVPKFPLSATRSTLHAIFNQMHSYLPAKIPKTKIFLTVFVVIS